MAPEARGPGAARGWDALYAALVLFGLPYFLYRRLVLRKDLEGRREKWGHLPERPPHPRRLWIHTVSVGEALAAQPLARALRERIPGVELVFSTTTQTGQSVARKLYGEASVFYYPLDFSIAVRRSLDRVKPALLVLLELEVWPNLTAEARARGIPVVVVNGRISPRSFRRYLRAAWLLGASFRRVRHWLVQTEEYAQRLRLLGVEERRIEVAGNLKYDDVETRPIGPRERAAARQALGLPEGAQVLLGGSTHPSEEAALLEAYRELRAKFPGLRLALAPRHPHRLVDVEKEIEAHGFGCLRRSMLKEQGAAAWARLPEAARAAAVVLIDTMGELKQLYRAADVAFVGGSLIPHGGQSVMEPAGLGLPAVYGPHMANFAEAVAILKAADGGVMLERGAADLPAALEKLLADPAAAKALGGRAREAFLKRQGAAARCVEYLSALLPP